MQLNIRPGGAGEGGILKRSKERRGREGLDTSSSSSSRGSTRSWKFFAFMTILGVTDGHAKAAEISRGRLRAILKAPAGSSPTRRQGGANKARVAELSEFDGLRFIVKVGVEKGQPEKRRHRRDLRRQNIIADRSSRLTAKSGARSSRRQTRRSSRGRYCRRGPHHQASMGVMTG